MTDATADTSPRFNPARTGAQRIRIDTSGAGTRNGSGTTWFVILFLLLGGLGGAYWAHDRGLIAIPGLNEVLARTPLGSPAPAAERLLEPGAEPLGALRYAWAEDLVVTNVLGVQVETALSIDGVPAEVEAQPGLRALFEARPGATSPQGGRFWNFELTELALTPPAGSTTPLPAEQQELLAPVKAGFSGTLLVSDRGQVEQASIEFPGAPAELQPLFDQLAQTVSLTLPSLPEEPIGLGARWRTALDVPGSEAPLDADHELTGLEGSSATLESTLGTGSKLPAAFRAPGLAQGAGELVLFRATGTLSRQLDLNGLVTTLDGETTVEAEFRAAGEDGLPRDSAVVTTYRTTVRGF